MLVPGYPCITISIYVGIDLECIVFWILIPLYLKTLRYSHVGPILDWLSLCVGHDIVKLSRLLFFEDGDG